MELKLRVAGQVVLATLLRPSSTNSESKQAPWKNSRRLLLFNHQAETYDQLPETQKPAKQDRGKSDGSQQ